MSLSITTMRSTLMKLVIFVASALALAHDKRQGYVGAGAGIYSSDDSLGDVGNAYNYWRIYPNGTYDLTRSYVSSVTSPKLLPFFGIRSSAIIEPSRSVLCIIDMQSCFLHPALAPTSDDGRAAVTPTVDLVKSFRKNGIKTAWINWGLNNYDLLMLPPSVKSGGFTNGSMGMVLDGNQTVDAGMRLMAGFWNTEPYGILKDFIADGIEAGTDLLFNKNRLSGLWGAQTPFGMWLQQNEITTIFIGGVDADQCVRTTFMDAHLKGEF
jgi:nicotinamidase-related amidase